MMALLALPTMAQVREEVAPKWANKAMKSIVSVLTYDKNNELLKSAKPNMKILHPLPRVNEIAYEVDDNPHAYYIQQAGNGLFAREAIFCDVLGISLDEVKNDKTIIK